MTDTVTPRIHIACLAAYNNGILHGIWIPANEGTDTIHVTIYNVLKTSPIPNAEEWAIHDYEGFGDLRIPENCSVEQVAAMANLITEHQDVALAALEIACGDIGQAQRLVEEFICEFDSLEDFGEHICTELETIPEKLAYYFDYAAYARDMELEGSITTQRQNGSLFVFWNT
jgi:antirestriction protein